MVYAPKKIENRRFNAASGFPSSRTINCLDILTYKFSNSSSSLDFLDFREAEAQRFQSAMSLYSNSLSAVIIFADKRLRYMTGIQKGFVFIVVLHLKIDFFLPRHFAFSNRIVILYVKPKF